jgi:hypothetical protein
MSQQGTFSVQGGDLPVTNYGATDIPAGVAVKLDTTAGNYLGVLPFTSSDQGKAFGVTVDAIKAGRPGRLRKLGSVLMTARGTLNPGDVVMASVDVGFEGQAKACAAATAQIGVALTIAADGGTVAVWLNPARNA